LEGDLKTYVEKFDFSRFGWKSMDEILDDHRQTTFWAQRFGGLLPPPPQGVVPTGIGQNESRYVRHILDAYEEHNSQKYPDPASLNSPELDSDLHLHRERFFDAEAFAHAYRDQTEPGTVESFQTEIHDSVQPLMTSAHQDGVERLSDVMQQAAATQPASILATQAKVRVKQGVCHQLANVDRLRWKTKCAFFLHQSEINRCYLTRRLKPAFVP
jgi:C-terminal domain 6 of the ABC-three component (ABC-3C) systems